MVGGQGRVFIFVVSNWQAFMPKEGAVPEGDGNSNAGTRIRRSVMLITMAVDKQDVFLSESVKTSYLH